MNFLGDILTYIRRIIKSPSDAVITDNLLIDYVNRFWIMDVDARMQLFDLKKNYQFQTVPGVDRYNMPLYNVQTQPGGQSIGLFPIYQGFESAAYINGVQVQIQTEQNQFFNIFPNIIQNLGTIGTGTGAPGSYNLQLPILPNNPPLNPPFSGILRGHIDTTGIIALNTNVDPPVVTSAAANPSVGDVGSIAKVPVTSVSSALYLTTLGSDGSSIVVADSGQFLAGNVNYGLLMLPGKGPVGTLSNPTFGNQVLPNGYSTTSNTINYFSGEINVEFPVTIPAGVNINAQALYFQAGLPRSILFYDNTLTLRSPPDKQYLVQLTAYLSPAAFLNTNDAIPFAYMAEYIARGAARKILSDTGDIEQFQFYEPLFREQELLVWKRSQRQWTASRTQTIYSQGFGQGFNGAGSIGGQAS